MRSCSCLAPSRELVASGVAVVVSGQKLTKGSKGKLLPVAMRPTSSFSKISGLGYQVKLIGKTGILPFTGGRDVMFRSCYASGARGCCIQTFASVQELALSSAGQKHLFFTES